MYVREGGLVDGGRGWDGCRPSPAKMADSECKWRFHQVFGEKGNYDDIAEGVYADPYSLGSGLLDCLLCKYIVQLTSIDLRGSHHMPDTADIISAVEFDHTGEFLATGDRGGRIVLFEQDQQVCECVQMVPSMGVTDQAPRLRRRRAPARLPSLFSIQNFKATSQNSII